MSIIILLLLSLQAATFFAGTTPLESWPPPAEIDNKKDDNPPSNSLLCRLMEQIYFTLIERVNPRGQFAAIVFVPQGVNTAADLVPHLNRYREGVNYRFSPPVPMQNGRGNTHSEQLVLNPYIDQSGVHHWGDLSEMYNAFRSFHRADPQYCLLYTYIFPCPRCANTIANTFPNGQFRNLRVYVGNSVDGSQSNLDDDDREASRNSLASQNIQLKYVRLRFYEGNDSISANNEPSILNYRNPKKVHLY